LFQDKCPTIRLQIAAFCPCGTVAPDLKPESAKQNAVEEEDRGPKEGRQDQPNEKGGGGKQKPNNK
jgi:hypothetical protein